jgi:ABC-type lipopolysaccharide export system ATPase subunit
MHDRGDNMEPAPGGVTGILEVDGVRLSFSERSVLRSVYLKVVTGRVTGLVGRNGCGKSCLMRIMHGSLDIPCKSVRIDGEWVEWAFEHGVMYAPQHGFIPAGRLTGNVLKDHGADFEELVSLFPAFKPHRRLPVAALSGGERRLLEVFAVTASPWSRFCLLDEPFSQVSPLNAGILKAMIGRAARGGKGILVSDHLFRDVQDIVNDLYIITDGLVRPVTSPADLRKFGYLK